ncbi:MAG TPA: GAF and ANTAR domain-containing protein [Frankiaceae bacterium]|nr:GAF and ANTAR domain-containing protein [Frankiaceae bacterium]
MTREELLTQTFVELADTLVTGFDIVELLHMLASRCVDLADVDAAGIMLADEAGSLRVVASSSERIYLLELFEVQHSEGPCLDAYETARPVVADLHDTEAWPTVRAEALRNGFQSVVALPMRLRTESIGALNLFRNERGTLPDSDVAVCRALADMATIGLLHERAVREARLLAEQLQSALNTRVLIEQAKGVVAERLRGDMDEAFGWLRTHARNNNLLIGDVARGVVERRIPVARVV